MPIVFVPSLMQKLCDGEQKLVIEGTNLRQVIDNLDSQYSGFKDRLVEDGKIKPNISKQIQNYSKLVNRLEKLPCQKNQHHST